MHISFITYRLFTIVTTEPSAVAGIYQANLKYPLKISDSLIRVNICFRIINAFCIRKRQTENWQNSNQGTAAQQLQFAKQKFYSKSFSYFIVIPFAFFSIKENRISQTIWKITVQLINIFSASMRVIIVIIIRSMEFSWKYKI